MEMFILSFIVTGTLFGIAYSRMKRSLNNKLVSEQDQTNSLVISESQLRQKTNSLVEELQKAKQEYETLASTSSSKIESLTHELSMLSGDQQEVRGKLDAVTTQLRQEQSGRTTAETELYRLKEHAGSTTAELHATIEKQTRELRDIQQHLHDESIARKHTEDLLSEKERTYQKTIAELRSKVDVLEQDARHASEQARSELSARQTVEKLKSSSELELITKITLLEAKLSAMADELRKTTETMQEEMNVRIATEKALQESKEKLYSHIHELEEQAVRDRSLIDEQKSKLSAAESKVQNLEQSVFTVIHHSPIPVFIVNEQGICELTNESLHMVIGFADDELVGKHFSRLFPEGERTFYEEQWRQTGNRPEEFKGETSIMTSTGDAVSAEISFVEIHTGTDRKFVGFIFDKTNELAAERHYAEARRRENELQQLKSRFISMVSNQLRAALVTVATNAELLERFVFKWNDEKRYRAFFRINESLKQMMDLLRDVEMTTHSSPDLYKRSIANVNLETLVQSAARDAMADTGSDCHFVFSEQGDIRSVSLDEHLTKTILYHLLSNAFKYSPNGNDVAVHVERNDTKCLVTVSDNGIGIPPEDQKNLFSSFFRASNAGNIHGSGLGLTIVHQYVQLSGGTISLTSALNKGTTVNVTIPIVAS